MSLLVGGNSKQFEIVSEGVVNAVLAAVQDLGEVTGQFGTKPKVRLVWLTNELASDGQQKIVMESMTNSLHEKASLTKRIRQITGQTPEDDGTFDLETPIGSQRQLVIEHNDASDGRTYANVQSVLKRGNGVAITIPKDFLPPKVKQAQPVKPKAENAKLAKATAAAVAATVAVARDDEMEVVSM
jgi:hypothetical protein